MSFMTKRVTLHFVCPVTRQLQVSGYYKGVVALHAHKLEHCLFGYTIDVYANWQLFFGYDFDADSRCLSKACFTCDSQLCRVPLFIPSTGCPLVILLRRIVISANIWSANIRFRCYYGIYCRLQRLRRG